MKVGIRLFDIKRGDQFLMGDNWSEHMLEMHTLSRNGKGLMGSPVPGKWERLESILEMHMCAFGWLVDSG